MKFLNLEAKKPFCIEIKTKEKKAYFYLGKSEEPIIMDLEMVEDNKFAFLYNGNRMYFTYPKSNTKEKEKNLLFFKIFNKKEFDHIHIFGMSSFIAFNNYRMQQYPNEPKFENTIKGCFEYMAWNSEEQRKMNLINVK